MVPSAAFALAPEVRSDVDQITAGGVVEWD